MSDTIHANCVTTVLNADELILEFRAVEISHMTISERGGKTEYMGDDIAKSPVLVRLAVTFGGSIVFANQLAEMIPKMHEFRVKQSAPWLTEETRQQILGAKPAEGAPDAAR